MNSSKLISGDEIYDFKILNTEDIVSYNDSLVKIQQRKIDGFLIKEVLSKTEISTLLENLKKVNEEEIVKREELEIYPRGFAAFKDNSDSGNMDTYFELGKNYRDNFFDQFQINLEETIQKVFSKIAGGRKILSPSSQTGKGNFVFGQFRTLYPDDRAMPLHCGNVFQRMYDGFYEYLSPIADIKNQMSYFILLQNTEIGGELTLYDLRWEEGQEMIPFEEMKEPDGTIRSIKDPTIERMVLRPEPGDMIIFCGGELWHKVESICGESDRITFGGFLGFSNSGEEVLLWA